MRDTVLLEEMTWPEVRDAIAAGKRRVIVMLAAMEQHGPHLPIGTDTYLGYATGVRLARRLGDSLVAPVLTLGYSAGHLPMAGTVSIEESTLETVIEDVCRSLARHGFREIILLCSHGGNYRALRGALPRLRDAHSELRISAVTDFDEWLRHTTAFAAREGLDTAKLGVHAAQGETSLMLAYRPELVQMDRACEGFIGDASIRWRSKVPPPMDEMSPTGILGDARGSTAELGEKMFTDRIERLASMIEAGDLAG
ncbi:MAG TPA: creatininase family protein [bacterium]|nr:creatininase family protein [bacterium]